MATCKTSRAPSRKPRAFINAAFFIMGVAVGFLCGQRWTAPNAAPVTPALPDLTIDGPNYILSSASFTSPIVRGSANFRKKYYSQAGQDQAVDEILSGITGGFFVESGAFNGVDFSNTLFFEAYRGWKGLLIEANPYLYRKIIDSSNRNATTIHACVSPDRKPTVLPFRLAGTIGGLVGHLTSTHMQRIHSELAADRQRTGRIEQESTEQDIDVSCWPLVSMLKALDIKQVDYWSLDTEGSEAAILAATDFDAVDIRVLTVEVNDGTAEQKVKNIMRTRPEYLLHSKSGLDLVYVKQVSHGVAHRSS